MLTQDTIGHRKIFQSGPASIWRFVRLQKGPSVQTKPTQSFSQQAHEDANKDLRVQKSVV